MLNTAMSHRDSTFLDGQQPSMEALEVLELVRSSLLEKPQSWQDCVYWARHRWESLYHNSIQQLLHSFPPDHVRATLQCPRSWPKMCPVSALGASPHSVSHYAPRSLAAPCISHSVLTSQSPALETPQPVPTHLLPT